MNRIKTFEYDKNPSYLETATSESTEYNDEINLN